MKFQCSQLVFNVLIIFRMHYLSVIHCLAIILLVLFFFHLPFLYVLGRVTILFSWTPRIKVYVCVCYIRYFML